ncbi:MAG: hypothetical protein K2P03_05840 [Lachnospiraceae bacterium]|jgi:hypothetical protein|nr:hypothetical protein [Lachnospiraceae bacterium]MDE7058221.1 hypothetical protein [Lachnospiraceae bacterium]
MKHFLKGVAAIVITMSISIAINIFCNINGISVNESMSTLVTTMFAVLLYQVLIRNEKDKDNKE